MQTQANENTCGAQGVWRFLIFEPGSGRVGPPPLAMQCNRFNPRTSCIQLLPLLHTGSLRRMSLHKQTEDLVVLYSRDAGTKHLGLFSGKTTCTSKTESTSWFHAGAETINRLGSQHSHPSLPVFLVNPPCLPQLASNQDETRNGFVFGPE